MSNLHEVVDFHAAPNACFTHAGTVNAGVRLHFHGIFQHRQPGLHDLVPGAGIIFGEAEAVRSNDGAVLQNDVVPELAILAHHGVGVREKVVSDVRAAVDDGMRQQFCVSANYDIGVDDDVGADVRVFANPGRRMQHCAGMNARRIKRRLVEERNGAGKRQVRIPRPQERSRDRREIFVHNYGRGLRGLSAGSVLRVGHEGDLASHGLLDASHPGNLKVGGGNAGRPILQARTQRRSNLSKFHGDSEAPSASR